MKNLITSIACMMLLLALILQFAQNQNLHCRLLAVNQAVSTFKEEAKQEGYISDENENWLREQLSGILSCKAEQISVSGTRKSVRQGELIEYQVKFPLTDLLISPEFWGIHETENVVTYDIHQFAVSLFDGGEKK